MLSLDVILERMERYDAASAAWLVHLHYIREHRLWRKAGYRSYLHFAQEYLGLQKTHAHRLARTGGVLIDLFPDLDPESGRSEESCEECPDWALFGRPGAALAPGRLRPLLALKAEGWHAEELRAFCASLQIDRLKPPSERAIWQAAREAR